MIKNGFIINGYHELIPDYKISPFSLKDISINRNLKMNDSIDLYFQNRFGNKNFIYTQNGRQALNAALSYYNLQPEDVVSILTPSNNLYISSCVTNEIELFCKWSREIEPKTKVIIINHEFGYSYGNLKYLQSLNIPIIEDCAYAFFTKGINNEVGKVGDFCIYSFPKMFPIQIGGLLKSNSKSLSNNLIEDDLADYIKKVLSYYITQEDEIIQKRFENFKLLTNLLLPLRIKPRFENCIGDVPGVYMFTSDLPINYQKLKDFMKLNGVQTSVFYGEESFFIPVHQNLTRDCLDYFVELIKYFVNSNLTQ